MSYRKVKKISIHGNSVNNLVLRQQFATKFVELAMKGKVFLNIDETWLGMSDFRRTKWQVKEVSNSTPAALMSPRLSMIVALDSQGNVYLSLNQANTNSSMTEIFLTDLVTKLDKERLNWRKNTVIFWDNASYHSSLMTRKTLQNLNIPILYTGPYSYSASPCELFFAQFKSVDINPRKIQQSKK